MWGVNGGRGLFGPVAPSIVTLIIVPHLSPTLWTRTRQDQSLSEASQRRNFPKQVRPSQCHSLGFSHFLPCFFLKLFPEPLHALSSRLLCLYQGYIYSILNKPLQFQWNFGRKIRTHVCPGNILHVMHGISFIFFPNVFFLKYLISQITLKSITYFQMWHD